MALESKDIVNIMNKQESQLTSKSSPLPRTSSHKLKRPSTNLVARCGYPNHTGSSPSTMSTLESSSHDGGDSCAAVCRYRESMSVQYLKIKAMVSLSTKVIVLKGVVTSPLGHVYNVSLDRFIKFGTVDGVGCPQCYCCGELSVRIDTSEAKKTKHKHLTLRRMSDG